MRFLFPMWKVKESALWCANIISLGTWVCRGTGLVDAGGTGGCTGDNIQCRRGRLTGVVAAPSLFSIAKYNIWYLNRQRNTHYDIIYYLNEMFIVKIWLVMLYIDLTKLKCSYHIDIECIRPFVSGTVFASILRVAVFAFGTLFEANRINAGLWCWWNIARSVLVEASF